MSDNTIPVCAGPDPQPRQPRLAVPPFVCDTQAHVFGPADRYPYTANRSYTPPDAPLAAYRHVLATLGLARGVLVQPSVYGTDNRLLSDSLAMGGQDLRGVAVVDAEIGDDALEDLHRLGVRGLRLNLLFKGGVPFAVAETLAARIRPLGWHLQFLINVSAFDDLRARLSRLPVEVVVDHMGHMPTALGIDHPGFQALLALVRDGHCWVRLSGAYRITSEQLPPYRDVTPFARALVAAAPERMLWASDWPHPMIDRPMPNDGDLLDLLADWVPEEDTRRRILVDNPARLYDFAG